MTKAGAFGPFDRRALGERKAPVHSDRVKTLAIDHCNLKTAVSQNYESPNGCAFERRIFLSTFFHLYLFKPSFIFKNQKNTHRTCPFFLPFFPLASLSVQQQLVLLATITVSFAGRGSERLIFRLALPLGMKMIHKIPWSVAVPWWEWWWFTRSVGFFSFGMIHKITCSQDPSVGMMMIHKNGNGVRFCPCSPSQKNTRDNSINQIFFKSSLEVHMIKKSNKLEASF